MTENIFTHPLQEPGRSSRFIEPCILVIFGATGDLTARKLLPALYNLAREGQLPPQFGCVGFARREKTNDRFRSEMKEAISRFSRVKPVDEALWATFEKQLFYYKSEFNDEKGFQGLSLFLTDLDNKLGTKGNRVFYLSTQPSYFTTIAENLHKACLVYDQEVEKERWSRMIIEKPFGHDLKSAEACKKI